MVNTILTLNGVPKHSSRKHTTAGADRSDDLAQRQRIESRCPLLIFGQQLADELNEFLGERNEDSGV